MKVFISLAMALLLASVAQPGIAAPTAAAAPARLGVLLLAHGGDKGWDAQVLAVAAKVDKKIPTEVAFGMADSSALQQGIDKLVARHVTRIVAVPLFISSYSIVIESTKYLLGIRRDVPPGFVGGAMGDGMGSMAGGANAGGATAPPQALKVPVPLTMAPALDRHPIVAALLADHAAAIGKDPAHEALILVAHGPNDDPSNALWLRNMASLAKQIDARRHYARIDCVTLRDDASPSVKDKARAILRKDALAADAAHLHVLIVPLLLSYGGIEDELRRDLDGVEHTFAYQGVLPDPRIATWVVQSALKN